jgi:hypothetical protein
MTTDVARTVGWKRFLRLVGALAIPVIAVWGFGAATVHADGSPRCEGGPDRVAHEGCGERDHDCERDGDCDRDHDEGQQQTPAPGPRPAPGPTPIAAPATAPATAPASTPVLAAAGVTAPEGPGGAPAAAGPPAASSPTAPTAPTTPSSPSPAGVQVVSLPSVRPTPVLVDLPLVRLLVIAVVVGVAAAVLPRAARRRR